ncbi:MAG: hypothetical protein Q8R28_14985 [Dehalococcoidia bacterium]|nr:hypothetical protein [Dehalococcoidia bacterium]
MAAKAGQAETGQIGKDCAELLVDLAGTVGTMQGLAAGGGQANPEIMKDITDAAQELVDAGVCPLRDEDKEHLAALAERIKGLAGADEIDMDAAIAVQDDLNAFLDGVLGHGTARTRA